MLDATVSRIRRSVGSCTNLIRYIIDHRGELFYNMLLANVLFIEHHHKRSNDTE